MTDETDGLFFKFRDETDGLFFKFMIEWTKGIRIAGTVGRPVGRLLAEELVRRGRRVRTIPVLNDTVASLLTAAAISPHSAHHIGL